MSTTRREFLQRASTISMGATLTSFITPEAIAEVERATRAIANQSAEQTATDEKYWESIQKAFHPSPDFINLENGYFAQAPVDVIETQIKHIRRINENASRYMRTEQEADRLRVRSELAEFAGCSVDEVVVTRNTTESLDTVISGIDLREGDEVVISDQDYGSMVEAFEQQSRRYGIVLKKIALPLHPSSNAEVVRAYESGMTARTKLVLVTHLINITGHILPVRQLCDMAHARGAEVIVDAAHSFAHIDFKIPELGCDYLGTSLHKWLSTPLGAGLLYVKKEKIKKVWPLFGDTSYPPENIRKFEHQGTQPISTQLAILAALQFHQVIGSKRKEEWLRFLKNYWVEKVRDMPRVIINTPKQSELSCAIANVAIDGMKPKEVSDALFERYKIFTVPIDSPVVKGVRVTPHLFTKISDLDLLVEGIRKLAR